MAQKVESISSVEIMAKLQDRLGDLAMELCGPQNEAMSSKDQWRFGNKGSLAVEIGGEKVGTFFDHEANYGGNALLLIRHKLGLDARAAFVWACKWLGVEAPAAGFKKLPKDPVAKIAVIVEETQSDITETPVKRYLHNRGITAIPPECIGYRPNAYGKYGAMVALARDIKGSVLALQQVYLTEDGQKAPLDIQKRTNKAVDQWASKAVVRFPGKEPVILAEGVETALSLWQATRQETWACLGISNMAKAPLPSKSTVILARDGDAPDSKATSQIRQAVFSMRKCGHKVGVASPPEGKDFNDVLVEDGEEAIRAAIAGVCFEEEKKEEDAPHLQNVLYADEFLTMRFSGLHEENLRYVFLWDKWLIWNGKCWEIDDTLAVKDACRSFVRTTSAEIMSKPEPNINLAASVASAKTIGAIERLARADRRHAERTETWDADLWLLNTPDGTVDLKTGLLRPHDREDYCTKMTAATPEGECPMWMRFLNRALDGDQDMIAFCQRVIGYGLTGEVREHALFFLYGPGGNGKGVFLNTCYKIMASYAAIAPMETFVATQNDRHPTDLAMMRGARIVFSQETEEGQRWAKNKIANLTGGDAIPARFMRQDFFTYQPQFKLVFAGNHKPSLRTVDEAMRRRINMIPFTVIIPEEERDPNLPEQFRGEWPGILKWALEGCLEWQRGGLQPPKAVRLATESYLAEEDTLQKFLDEKCFKTSQSESEEVSLLFASWKEWCAETGEFVGSIKNFSQKLEMRGYEKRQDSRTRRACFAGLRLLEPPIGTTGRIDFDREAP